MYELYVFTQIEGKTKLTIDTAEEYERAVDVCKSALRYITCIHVHAMIY